MIYKYGSLFVCFLQQDDWITVWSLVMNLYLTHISVSMDHPFELKELDTFQYYLPKSTTLQNAWKP